MIITNRDKDIIVVINRETKETRTIIIPIKLTLPNKVFYKKKEINIEIRSSIISTGSPVTRRLATLGKPRLLRRKVLKRENTNKLILLTIKY